MPIQLLSLLTDLNLSLLQVITSSKSEVSLGQGTASGQSITLSQVSLISHQLYLLMMPLHYTDG